MLDPKEKEKLQAAINLIDENLTYAIGDLKEEIINLLKPYVNEWTCEIQKVDPFFLDK